MSPVSVELIQLVEHAKDRSYQRRFHYQCRVVDHDPDLALAHLTAG